MEIKELLPNGGRYCTMGACIKKAEFIGPEVSTSGGSSSDACCKECKPKLEEKLKRIEDDRRRKEEQDAA